MTLFGEDLVPVVPVAEEKLSPDRRRTLRQRQAVDRNVHPLALVHPWIRVMPNRGQRTCGNCRFRELLDYHGRAYPKCTVDGELRIAHSTATDVRAWWPACIDHEWGDNGLSPDAARHVPDELGGTA